MTTVVFVASRHASLHRFAIERRRRAVPRGSSSTDVARAVVKTDRMPRADSNPPPDTASRRDLPSADTSAETDPVAVPPSNESAHTGSGAAARPAAAWGSVSRRPATQDCAEHATLPSGSNRFLVLWMAQYDIAAITRSGGRPAVRPCPRSTLALGPSG